MTDTNESKLLKPFISELEVGNPLGHLNLTLVPLRGKRSGYMSYLLAADAITTGQLTVTEVDEGGSVPEIMVTSTADVMILLLDGEELAGAKQNRILNTTILLPARAKMRIPVSCVEQGRWHSESIKFMPAESCAPPKMRADKSVSVSENLRSTGRPQSDQSKVWEEVAFMVADCKAPAPTQAMSDVVKHKRVSIDQYAKALEYPAEARGVAVAINGKFVALDLFDKPGTLERIWPRLTRGYALEATLKNPDGHFPFTAKDARDIIEQIGKIECQPFPSVGVGSDWRFEAEAVLGQALVADDACVHLCAFPNTERNRRYGHSSGSIAPPNMRRQRRRRIFDDE